MRSILTTSASILVAASLMVATGCQAPPDEMPYQTMDLAEPVPMSYKAIGGHPALTEPGVKLISTQAELDALGVDDLLGRKVNFNNDEVILATLGEMPTAGYWINITAINQEGDLLQVYGQANRPTADMAVGQMLTYPYCAVIIPQTVPPPSATRSIPSKAWNRRCNPGSLKTPN